MINTNVNKQKQTKSRNWSITYNIPLNTLEFKGEDWLKVFHEKTGSVYTVGQLERAPTTYTNHIQAYANFKEPKTLTSLKKFDNTMHLEECRDSEATERYCLKEDTRVDGPWTIGQKPVRRNSKTDWDEVWLLAKKRDLEKIPKDVLIAHYSNIQKIAKDHMVVEDCGHLRGIFIYGVSGIGKSLLARGLFPNFSMYTKPHTKWFDAYSNEQIIIWDDITPQQGVTFGNYLKLWTDRYGVKGETKGSAIPLNHEYFIMTSQYSFEETFADHQDREALSRRCYVYNMAIVNKELNVLKKFDMNAMHQKLSLQSKPNIENYVNRIG